MTKNKPSRNKCGCGRTSSAPPIDPIDTSSNTAQPTIMGASAVQDIADSYEEISWNPESKTISIIYISDGFHGPPSRKFLQTLLSTTAGVLKIELNILWKSYAPIGFILPWFHETFRTHMSRVRNIRMVILRCTKSYLDNQSIVELALRSFRQYLMFTIPSEATVEYNAPKCHIDRLKQLFRNIDKEFFIDQRCSADEYSEVVDLGNPGIRA